MKILWSCPLLATLCLAPLARADEPAKAPPKSFQVPYRLTKAKHILVRAKINGKGPYNFIVDTGAPTLFVAVPVARKLGVQSDGKGWGAFDRFEIEGGVVLTKVKGRIETPPQVTGMNALGLAGVELHGMIGYTILAHYRMEIDFTRDKMVWTRLDYKPRGLMSLGVKGGSAGGLDLMSDVLQLAGKLLGTKASRPVHLCGFLGVELKDVKDEDKTIVQSVLANGPAGKAGLKVGDEITHVQGRGVFGRGDVQRFVERLAVGDDIKLTVRRGEETKDITFKIGEGI